MSINKRAITTFAKRLFRSKFGWSKIKRIIRSYLFRKRLITKICNGKELTTRHELQLILGVPALINDPEIVLLQKYARIVSENAVEIGSAFGGSSFLFLFQLPRSAHLFSIDPFIVDSMGEFQATYELCYQHVTRALTDFGLEQKKTQWTLLPHYSFDVVKTWNHSIDVLFIDGDHRYEPVKRDFNEWFPFVKEGGFILFHDSCKPLTSVPDRYDHGWEGPSKLSRELQADQRLTLVEQVFSISVFKKLHG